MLTDLLQLFGGSGDTFPDLSGSGPAPSEGPPFQAVLMAVQHQAGDGQPTEAGRPGAPQPYPSLDALIAEFLSSDFPFITGDGALSRGSSVPTALYASPDMAAAPAAAGSSQATDVNEVVPTDEDLPTSDLVAAPLSPLIPKETASGGLSLPFPALMARRPVIYVPPATAPQARPETELPVSEDLPSAVDTSHASPNPAAKADVPLQNSQPTLRPIVFTPPTPYDVLAQPVWDGPAEGSIITPSPAAPVAPQPPRADIHPVDDESADRVSNGLPAIGHDADVAAPVVTHVVNTNRAPSIDTSIGDKDSATNRRSPDRLEGLDSGIGQAPDPSLVASLNGSVAVNLADTAEPAHPQNSASGERSERSSESGSTPRMAATEGVPPANISAANGIIRQPDLQAPLAATVNDNAQPAAKAVDENVRPFDSQAPPVATGRSEATETSRPRTAGASSSGQRPASGEGAHPAVVIDAQTASEQASIPGPDSNRFVEGESSKTADSDIRRSGSRVSADSADTGQTPQGPQVRTHGVWVSPPNNTEAPAPNSAGETLPATPVGSLLPDVGQRASRLSAPPAPPSGEAVSNSPGAEVAPPAAGTSAPDDTAVPAPAAGTRETDTSSVLPAASANVAQPVRPPAPLRTAEPPAIESGIGHPVATHNEIAQRAAPVPAVPPPAAEVVDSRASSKQASSESGGPVVVRRPAENGSASTSSDRNPGFEPGAQRAQAPPPVEMPMAQTQSFNEAVTEAVGAQSKWSSPGAASTPAAQTTTASQSAGFRAAVDHLEQTHQVSAQMVRGVRMVSRGGASSVTLRLDPAELGEVTIRLASRDGSLSGDIAVQNRAVQEIAQRSLGDLRNALVSQGVQVDQLHVSIDSHGQAQQDREAFQSLMDQRADRDASGQGGSGNGSEGNHGRQQAPARNPDNLVDLTA